MIVLDLKEAVVAPPDPHSSQRTLSILGDESRHCIRPHYLTMYNEWGSQ
jgi:hypothetical protein